MVDGAFIDDVEKRVICSRILYKDLLLPTAQNSCYLLIFDDGSFSEEKHIRRY